MSRRASRCRCGRADAEHGEEVLCALAPQLDTETELDAGVVTAHCVTTSGWNGAPGVHHCGHGLGTVVAQSSKGRVSGSTERRRRLGRPSRERRSNKADGVDERGGRVEPEAEGVGAVW
jgi:hypothetical protein